MRRIPVTFLSRVCLAAIAAALLWAGVAGADGKVGLYGIRMVPTGQDAEEFSRASWGGGIDCVVPAPFLGNLVAANLGIEFVSMLTEKTTTYDQQTLLRVEQQTSQEYGRFYLGPEFGPHGPGFFRPHAGANLAVVFYGISTDVVVPDDYNRQQEIRQNLRDENRVAMGYDLNAGADFNFWNKMSFDTGVRFLKSFNVPQQLGAGSVTISPGYFQVYAGLGVSFGWIRRAGESREGESARD